MEMMKEPGYLVKQKCCLHILFCAETISDEMTLTYILSISMLIIFTFFSYAKTLYICLENQIKCVCSFYSLLKGEKPLSQVLIIF